MMDCVLASGNQKKIEELQALLQTFDLNVMAQSEFNIAEVEETGTTFVENAIIKARHAARASGLAAIADDSGICVPSLQGAPGVFSARYSSTGTDADNNAKLLAALNGQQHRSAYYVCVIVLMRHADDPLPLIAQGKWLGEVLDAPRGQGGFGYDPLFYLPEIGMTAAQLEAEHKNRISHRALALKALHQLLVQEKLAGQGEYRTGSL